MSIACVRSLTPMLVIGLSVAACSGGREAVGQPEPGPVVGPKVIRIDAGPEAERLALTAFFEAGDGDIIEFGEGQFNFENGLLMFSKQGVTIRGEGMEKTLLSFANSANKEGIFASHVTGLTIEDLTVEDMPGDGVKVSDGRFVTIRRVKVRWTNADPTHANYDASQASWAANGAYSFYPVLTTDTLVEDSISIGSSDVGFYVGQSQRVVVRNNLAFHNVQGYEFENTDDSEMYDNLARDNAGGFLAVDLPGRTRYGDKNRFYRNRAIDNNIDNFAPKGTIAAAVPRGTGFIILATDQVEVFDNEFRNNDTLGLVVVGYNLVDSSTDPQFDYYAEGIHVHNNVFADNGTNPQLPVLGPEDLPDPTGNPSLLPLLIMIKNFGQTAHIVWDGYTDTLNPDCAYPEGAPADERGKPQYSPEHPAPDCGRSESGIPVRYNAYKFDAAGELIKPQNWLCIHDNVFENSTIPTPEFVNFGGTVPAPVGGSQDQPLASRDQTPHQCELPALPATLLGEYQPGSGAERGPSEAEILAACSGGAAGQVNWAAVNFNCPDLADYGLFENPADPRSAPRADAMPFDLTTPLFSDYASKYRFVFLPPGGQARWRGQEAGPNAHIEFPAGTIIAKTFSFRDGDDENVVETRLLIKRETSQGVLWQGLPYLWRETGQGRVASLEVAGAKAAVSWDYEDPDPEARNAAGERPRYVGSTAAYAVPQAAQCVSCHAREGLEAGTAPIGPKPRALNRDYDYGGAMGIRNQLAHWCESGFMTGCPSDLGSAPKLAVWNVPGSGGEDPGSDTDVEHRARAYLEANCAHCHNPKGVAKSTRMNLDRFILREDGSVEPRPVNRDYGICKSPVASGRGTGDRLYDIVPGDPDASIMHFRLGNGDDPAIRMPPIARSVVHAEGFALIEDWISRLPLPTTEDDNCSGALGGLPLPLR